MKSMGTQKPQLKSDLFESPGLYSVSSRSVAIRAPTSLVEMKSTIHEVTRTARRRLVFCDASCDFVDRPLPSKQKRTSKLNPLSGTMETCESKSSPPLCSFPLSQRAHAS